MMNEESVTPDEQRLKSLKTITLVVYGLQAASIFIPGVPAVIAIIINYVKKDDVQGTWLESHFRWQIRTFWFGLLWLALGAITYLLVVGYFILLAAVIWLIYRIIKGWLYLLDGKVMYASPAKP
jgi:uncharacterized membrane protein